MTHSDTWIPEEGIEAGRDYETPERVTSSLTGPVSGNSSLHKIYWKVVNLGETGDGGGVIPPS